jgi:hypothetical protein
LRYGRRRSDCSRCVTGHSALEGYNELDGREGVPLEELEHWYRFARETLEYGPQEATGYANLRFAEELNRRASKGHPLGS